MTLYRCREHGIVEHVEHARWGIATSHPRDVIVCPIAVEDFDDYGGNGTTYHLCNEEVVEVSAVFSGRDGLSFIDEPKPSPEEAG